MAARSRSALPKEVREEDFPHIAGHVRRLGEMELATISDIVRSGVESGEFRDVNVELMSSLVLAVLKGVILADERHPGQGDRVVGEAVGLLTRGLATKVQFPG